MDWKMILGIAGFAVAAVFLTTVTSKNEVVYEDKKITLDVSKWYSMDSAMKGCNVYLLHGSSDSMKFKIGQIDKNPAELYVVKCKDGIAVTAAPVVSNADKAK